MENLVDALAGVVAKPLVSPFTPETIVVQSKGMQRWLSMELAKKLGIWANCTYPFPNKMVWDLFCGVFKAVPDISPFAPEVLTWRIMALLPHYLDREAFAPLKYYLAGDRGGLKRFQLAGKIADSFDQYTLFRPDMILEWEEGDGEEWQQILWRVLVADAGGQHRARLKREFLRQHAQRPPEKGNGPERISVFGISYLPRYHVDILAELAGDTEVNLFLLSPCREYWGDIVSARERARRNPEERVYLDEGNPLLASLGTLARDFSNMVITAAGDVAADLDLYTEPDEGGLLAELQSDILNLRGGEAGQAKRTISPEDRSVRIHSCHSPLREIEVLHDNLLALLEEEKGLSPRDIVVMTPDIEIYAPYISMIFEGCQDPAGKIPYSIADRSLAREGTVAAVFLKLLVLPGSRLTAAGVFDILESPPVSRRFGLDAQELGIIRSWIEDTRIRWGADEMHRADFGLPAYRENSWAAGLDRLLLGYALPEEGENLFNGILPFDEMEGSVTRTLGTFVDFVQKMVRLKDELAVARSVGMWREELRSLLADFIVSDDDSAFELAAVAGVVDTLEELGEKAQFTERVELALVRTWLSSRLEGEQKGFGFITGGVTFCAMLPMRSIPFPVVALVGMNDTAFPRQSRPPGFDLIARNPRPGDRSLRDEDRYLFLEALLSARRYFYISYVGQSIADNSTVPPSVLVSEFLDSIERCFSADGTSVESMLVTRHRLQAFNMSYFRDDSRLFSYSRENCAALREAAAGPRQQAAFIAAPLKEPPPEMREVSLAQLLRFFTNPARYLLENRLQIRLEEIAPPLEDREPFGIAGLESYNLKQELLERRLRGADEADFPARARCRGILPPARHGEALFAEAAAEVDTFVAAITAETAGLRLLEPLHFDAVVGNFRLFGTLDGVWSEKKIACRCAKLKAKDEIRSWIEHLALNAFAPETCPRESLLIMKDTSVTYRQVDNPVGILATWLAWYWKGLLMPLRFFPATSLEFVASGGNLEKARKKWSSGFRYTGEEEDPCFRLCFDREDDPLSGDFELIARELLSPMIAHR
jgi:exodeoxyribonuclease V gamma subunit